MNDVVYQEAAVAPGENRNIIVRLAQEKDRETLMTLAKEDHGDSAFSAIRFSVFKANTNFDSALATPTTCTCIVVEVKKKVVGFTYGTIGEYFVGEGTLIGGVQVLYTSRKIKNSLLGGKAALRLFNAFSTWSKANGANYVLINVTSGSHNSTSDRFFRKLGMQALGGNYVSKLT